MNIEFYRTGFMTSKGKLIRAILFPKPIHFRFYSRFYADKIAVIKIENTFQEPPNRLFYIHSILLRKSFHPYFPAALTSTTAFAQRSLLAKKIFCLHSKHKTKTTF